MGLRDLNSAPGIGPTHELVHRQVTLGQEKYLPGLFVIDGANARDPLNPQTAKELRPGLLVGRITASKKFGASVIGAVTDAYSSGGTELKTTPAAAAELVRRVGASGTFRLVSAPTNSGTVAIDTVTYSAVNATTGVITVTNIGKNVVAGSLIQPQDGSETPVTILPNGYPIRVVDDLDQNRDVELPAYLIGGLVDSSQILNWPSSSPSLQQWIVEQLNAVGQFTFNHLHGLD